MSRMTNEEYFFRQHVAGDARVALLVREARKTLAVLEKCHSCSEQGLGLAATLRNALVPFARTRRPLDLPSPKRAKKKP
jgi:hypothetical protein